MSIYIVLKPGPVQDLGFRFWPGHHVGRVSSVFFKSKWRRFSKKTKKNKSQRVCNRVFPGQSGRRVTPGVFFLRFFFNPAWFQSRITRSWVDQSDRTEFQNYAYTSYGSMTRFKTGYLVALCPHQLNQTGKNT